MGWWARRARRAHTLRPARTGVVRVERFILASLLAAVSLLAGQHGFLWRWDQLLFDLHLSVLTRDVPPDVIIIAIDDASLSELGRWPWSRATHAKLLQQLSTEHPRAVGFDILFTEPADASGDQQFAMALEQFGRGVLAVYVEPPRLGGQLIERLPIPALAVSAAGLGHVHVELDRDGIARSVFLREGLGEPRWRTLGLAVLEADGDFQLEHFPGLRNPERPGRAPQAWVRDYLVRVPFAGPPGHFQRISYSQALRGEYPVGTFTGKYVFVGVTASGMGDALPTPVSGQNQFMPGVEFNANVLDALRSNLMITPLSRPWYLTLSALFAFMPVFLYARMPPRFGLATSAGCLLFVVVVSAALLGFAQLWFAPSAALLAILSSYPLWSWRRLTVTARFLDQELERLNTERRELPATRAEDWGQALEFLVCLLPLDGWSAGSISQSWSRSGGTPPSSSPTLVPAEGEWLAQDGVTWGCAEVKGERCLVGLRWQEGVTLDERTRAILDLFLTSGDRRSPLAPRSTIEAVERRIEEVQGATERLRALHDVINDGLSRMADAVLVVSPLGLVRVANRQAGTLLAGDDHANLLGRQVLELLADVELDPGTSWPSVLLSTLRDGTEHRLDGRTTGGRDVLIHSASLSAAGTRPSGLVINLSDVSHLMEAERRQSEVLGFLSHDLRSPLVSVLALVELAESKATISELRELFARAEGYVSRTLELAEQLLALAQAEDPGRANWSDVDLVSVAVQSLDQVWAQARSKEIKLTRRLEIDEAWLYGDPSLLERAMVNLLTNAIKYSPPASEVELHVGRSARAFSCCVVDHGYGIEQRDLSRLFDRFERLSAARRSDAGGVGLGLAFVKIVAERHGANVEVESVPGEGSRFCLVFPAEVITAESTQDC